MAIENLPKSRNLKILVVFYYLLICKDLL